MHASTIPEVIAHLQQIVADEAAAQSRLALFPALYCELTQRLAAGLAAGEFREPERIEQVGARFANRYFDALTAYRNGDEPTRSWAVSFEQARSGRLLTIQDLLLGINAHINLDLAIATAEIGGDRVADLHADFLHVNVLLEDLFDRTQNTLAALSPLLDILDRLGRDGDEWLGNFVLKKARDVAWENAVMLAGLGGAPRAAWVYMLDVSASRLGHMIASPSYLVRKAIELIRETEEQDVKVIVAALARVAD
ncbi:MAG TPA: DUF5995 family protein [Enhygromyxa sp.]|nr:DUF5995 family protein [Enhygromyxa sp.]